MTAHGFVLAFFALSVALATVLVSGRLLWCVALAIRARSYGIAALSAGGTACLLALLLAVLFMWFTLAVSHLQKDISDTYELMALTGLPYFLASFFLWRWSARFQLRLRSTADR